MTPRFPGTALVAYTNKLIATLQNQDWTKVAELARALEAARENGRRIFVCGNGGSAANAMHWVNDFLYSITKNGGKALRAEALPANSSALTCLANDIGYENVFAHQVRIQGQKDDLLIVLSGSGNSPNILKALEVAKELGMESWAVVGFDGGRARGLASHSIHFEVDDMQVAEDTQMVVCHALAKILMGKVRSASVDRE